MSWTRSRKCSVPSVVISLNKLCTCRPSMKQTSDARRATLNAVCIRLVAICCNRESARTIGAVGCQLHGPTGLGRGGEVKRARFACSACSECIEYQLSRSTAARRLIASATSLRSIECIWSASFKTTDSLGKLGQS